MKISLIISAALLSLGSAEASLLSLHFAGLNLFQSFVIGSGLTTLSLAFWCFFAEGLYRFLTRWPYAREWLVKKRSKNDLWVARCYRYRYWGLFFSGFAPFIGIATQKIFRFKYGYFPIFLGNIAKVGVIVGGIGFFGYFLK